MLSIKGPGSHVQRCQHLEMSLSRTNTKLFLPASTQVCLGSSCLLNLNTKKHVPATLGWGHEARQRSHPQCVNCRALEWKLSAATSKLPNCRRQAQVDAFQSGTALIAIRKLEAKEAGCCRLLLRSFPLWSALARCSCTPAQPYQQAQCREH